MKENIRDTRVVLGRTFEGSSFSSKVWPWRTLNHLFSLLQLWILLRKKEKYTAKEKKRKKISRWKNYGKKGKIKGKKNCKEMEVEKYINI